uniref:Uncharacterized protein n=1 Tax=Brassica oleracea var. oleracea TaxID=109376 RepID=A0A0D3CDL4_BRAOL
MARRHKMKPIATSSERHHQVAREETTRERRLQSDTARSFARRRPGSDVFGATQPGLAKKRPGSDLSQRRAEVAPCLFACRTHVFLGTFWSFHYEFFLLSKPMFKYLL